MHLLIIIYYHCYTHNTFRNLSDDFSSHLTFMMGSSLVAQSVKSLTTMWETQVQSLGREIPWGRKWQPTPALLPGEFHEQRSLGGYSLWGHKESDTTEHMKLKQRGGGRGPRAQPGQVSGPSSPFPEAPALSLHPGLFMEAEGRWRRETSDPPPTPE